MFNSSVLEGEKEIAMVFAEYDSSVLYPLPQNSELFADENVTYTNFSVSSNLVTASIVGHEDDVIDLQAYVSIFFTLNPEVFD